MHLACVGDALVALLLDLSDTAYPWAGASRDARLSLAWDNYKSYCQYWNAPDRCERKVFTNELLKGAKNPFHRSACGDAQRIKHWAQVYIQGSKYQNNTNQFQIPAWKTRGVQLQEKFSTPPKVPHKSNFGTLSRNFSQRLLKPVKFLKPVCLHSNNLVQEQLPLQDEGPQVYC